MYLIARFFFFLIGKQYISITYVFYVNERGRKRERDDEHTQLSAGALRLNTYLFWVPVTVVLSLLTVFFR